MKIATMNDLYFAMLKDILYAEKKLTKALGKMAKNAKAPQLKKAFENHLTETQTHVERLEQVFQSLGKAPKAEKCEAIDGIIKEAEEVMGDVTDEQVMDAAIIACAQKAEHYEIATYGTLCEFAKLLGYKDQAAILTRTLNEEKSADEKLSTIAKNSANQFALAA